MATIDKLSKDDFLALVGLIIISDFEAGKHKTHTSIVFTKYLAGDFNTLKTYTFFTQEALVKKLSLPGIYALAYLRVAREVKEAP